MAKIDKSEGNIYEIPSNVSVCNGYVYLNTTTTWVQSKSGGSNHCDHDKVCIGKTVVGRGKDWKSDRRMYANSTYLAMINEEKEHEEVDGQEQEESRNQKQCENGSHDPSETTTNDQEESQELQDPKFHSKLSSVSIGAFVLVRKLCEDCGLIEILKTVFDGVMKRVFFILDLAIYFLLDEEAEQQYFEFFARKNATFSNCIMSESTISKQLPEYTMSEIDLFKTLWARKALIDELRFREDIIVCYDSTNVNSQAEGVFLVEKGHAKDNPSLPQVNTDYVVSERDGMPITFTKYPGSITDVSEATSVITFLKDLFSEDINKKLGDLEKEVFNIIKEKIIVCCDRGYISEQNVEEFDNASIHFLLLLKRNLAINNRLISQYCDAVKSLENYDPKTKLRAMTVRDYLFESDRIEALEANKPERKLRWFHIVWSQTLYNSHFNNMMNIINSLESRLKKIVEKKTTITINELKKFLEYFDVEIEFHSTSRITKDSKTSEEKLYTVKSFSRNYAKIDEADKKLGFFVLVSSKEMSAFEALAAYSKRDCVEKVFQALKSFMGMECEGVQSDAAMHTQALIWFVAAIMRCHLMIISRNLKCSTKDRRNYTVPCMIKILQEITADKNLITGKYGVRYTLTKRQKTILEPAGITKQMIIDYAKTL